MSKGIVRAEEHRTSRSLDPVDVLLAEIRTWIRSGPDHSTLKLSKRGGSVKVTAELNGSAIEVLRELNNGRRSE